MAHTSSVICFHQRPLTVFASPGRYVQGPGATHELGRQLQRLGLSGRVLFVAGRTARRWGPAAARPPIRPGPWRMRWICRRSSPPPSPAPIPRAAPCR